VKISWAVAVLSAVAATAVYQTRYQPVLAAAASPPQSAPADASAAGEKVFLNNCSMCHGEKMEGHPPMFPSLAGVGNKLTTDQITDLVRHGRRQMPAFAKLSDEDLAALLQYLTHNPVFTPPATGAAAASSGAAATLTTAATPAAAHTDDPGSALYLQNCTFCHGKDLAGGESGPDLTRSKLVAQDVNGNLIGPVVRNGRGDGKMPKFNFSDVELASLVKFIHTQTALVASRPGGRRGVDVADLQTGNVEAGKRYFEGAGGCSKCHSPTGDLAGIASKYQGLQLEERMLYPRDAKSTITVTLPSGETVSGVLEYQDEFVVGLRDSSGVYRSWPVSRVKFTIDSPVNAHVALFPKYTDDDIHNLMAYIQTLKEVPSAKLAKPAKDSEEN
jgi:mono/diheme cytochrome c family protein